MSSPSPTALPVTAWPIPQDLNVSPELTATVATAHRALMGLTTTGSSAPPLLADPLAYWGLAAENLTINIFGISSDEYWAEEER